MVAWALVDVEDVHGVESDKLIDCMHLMMWMVCMCISMGGGMYGTYVMRWISCMLR